MSQIEELQSRITAAMARIGAGVAALSEQVREPAADVDAAALTEALEEEKLANAQLEERLRAVKQAHSDEIAALRSEMEKPGEADLARAELAAQTEAMVQLDMDVQRLRQANDQLRASNAALRAANEEGVGEPHLINKAMLAELEGLRAARAADLSEAGAVLARLEPLLDGVAAQANGEGA
jgi:chromosome segregation ATPase